MKMSNRNFTIIVAVVLNFATLQAKEAGQKEAGKNDTFSRVMEARNCDIIGPEIRTLIHLTNDFSGALYMDSGTHRVNVYRLATPGVSISYPKGTISAIMIGSEESSEVLVNFEVSYRHVDGKTDRAQAFSNMDISSSEPFRLDLLPGGGIGPSFQIYCEKK